MLCFVAVLIIEYMGFRQRTKEYRELEHFAEFLSNLKDQFYLCKNVTESVFRAAEHTPGSLRKRLEEISFISEEDVTEPTIAEERFPKHLKLLRLFWIQCRSAVRYGSGKNSTESVFVKNMTELRRDVQNECYQRIQSQYLFAGMGVIAVVPMVFLPFIRWFGSVTMEELQTFYEGRAGKTVVVIFCLLTMGCYLLLYLTRTTDKRVYRRPEPVNRFFTWWDEGRKEVFLEGSRPEKKGRKRLAEAGIDANGMQYWWICGISGIAGTLVTIVLSGGIPLLYRMLWCVFGAGAGTGIMMGFYRYLGYLRRLGMDGEVLGLQAVVLLLIDVPNITLTELLDVLGTCGELFQKRICRCADEYAAEDVRALERLFEEEATPAFHRLAGRLLASERVGLKTAFEEIAADRLFFREQLRLDAEQERKKKAANAQVIAFLPMIFLIFAYLIVPFLGASLEQMGEIFREMDQVRYFY